MPDGDLDDLARRLEHTRWARTPATTTGATASGRPICRSSSTTGASATTGGRRRRRSTRCRSSGSRSTACRSTTSTSRPGAGPDAADPLARLAVDVLGLPQGHRPADRPAAPTAATPPTPSTSSSRRCRASASRCRCRAGRERSRDRRPVGALMRDVLGYERYAAHGGDWGGARRAQLGHKLRRPPDRRPPWLSLPDELFQAGCPPRTQYADDEKDRFHHTEQRMARRHQPPGRPDDDPQTLAYGLNDSPAGLLRVDPRAAPRWSDSGGDVESRFTKDELITTAMLYWVTDTMVTSMRVLLGGPAPAVEAVARPQAGGRGADGDHAVAPGAHAHARRDDGGVLQPPAPDGDAVRWALPPDGGARLLVEDLRAFFGELR